MKKVIFVANPNSPHVAQWVKAFSPSTNIIIYHIPQKQSNLVDCQTISPLPDFLHRLPKLLNYFLLGLYLRFFLQTSLTLHAHNTSGYGFSTLLSGKKYGITTYGSEIYSIEKKGRIYKFLIKLILKYSNFVTASSEAIEESIKSNYPKDKIKVTCIKMGLAKEFTSKTNKITKNNKTKWIANRRITPLYDTEALIKAFINFKKSGGKGELYLLKGQADVNYFNHIKTIASSCSSIKLINSFLSSREMADILKEMDFTISIPKTDQLSSAILEGMGCGSVPIIRFNKAYASVNNLSIIIDEEHFQKNLEKMFFETNALSSTKYIEMSNNCMDFIKENYSRKSFEPIYFNLFK